MSHLAEPLAMPERRRVSVEEARQSLGDGVLSEPRRMDSRVRGNDEGVCGSDTNARDVDARDQGRVNEPPALYRPVGAVRQRGWGLRLAALAAMVLAMVGCEGGCGDAPPESQLATEGPASLVALAVEVQAPEDDDSLGVVRSTFQANAAGATWYDALAAPGRDPAMGLAVGETVALHGWRWWSDADSVALGPAERMRGIARPDVAVRSYMQRDTSGFFGRLMGQLQGDRPSRLSERVTLLDGTGDGQAALLIEVADSVGTVGFRPVRGERRAAGDYRIEDVGGVLAFAAAADVSTDTTVVPTGAVWTAVAAAGGVRSTSAAADVPEGGRDQTFRLGEVVVQTPGAVAVATGATAAQAAAGARAALANGDARRQSRSARLAAVVDDVAFTTDDPTMNAAYRWAALSLDALVARDDSAGVTILPGLPTAEPATFPSAAWVVGALLDTGQWETARELITTLGDAQRFDRRQDLLGRAPDLVRLGDRDDVFASADGTPLFLKAAGDYVRVTGDRGLVQGGPNFWFKTVFALRGIYEGDSRNGNATDSLGYLVARDNRGTWLEGDPDLGGIRRRGAVAEGQGALYGALSTATQFAKIMGVSQRSSASWYADTSRVLVRSFERDFVRDGLIADEVSPQASGSLRPGGLLALALMDGLPAEQRGQLARALADRLVFPYGVASLAQTDSLFHPYLEAPQYYTPESARSNGAVWTWLTGPVATLMAQTGGAAPAAELVDGLARQLLDAGTVGAIPELVAGHPRGADVGPEVGGAPVNPWSIAGFIGATVEGLVGAEYASSDTLVVTPRLPEAWGETTVRMRLGDGSVRMTLANDGGRAEVAPEGALPAGATLVYQAAGRRLAVPLVLTQGDTLVSARPAFTLAVSAGGAEVDGDEAASEPVAGPGDAWDGFAFAEPTLRDEYPVMRAVANRRQLSDAQILRVDPSANVVLTQTDPDGDDWGATSTFTYPEGVRPDVLDASYLEVSRDDSTTYFRAEFAALADPGQTIVAFAIDTGEGGAETVAFGADYDFPADGGYEYLVVVGDGLLVEDAQGQELGRLSSGSAFNPAEGTLEFALPGFIVPPLSRARVTMLVGALEPGGVGSFRTVTREATETTGGGRVDPRSPNVYDVVVGSVR